MLGRQCPRVNKPGASIMVPLRERDELDTGAHLHGVMLKTLTMRGVSTITWGAMAW
jgi:hypothetical protein